MAEIMEGRATDAQIAGFLVGLAMKGERAAEIVGLARTMRAHAVKPVARRTHRVFDTCGTGGDRSGTFNISSCAALVVAACGVRVAKHGNRSVSSLSGSADVFEALGRQRHAPRRPSSNDAWPRRTSGSSLRRPFIRRCGTRRRRAARSASGPRSTCSDR